MSTKQRDVFKDTKIVEEMYTIMKNDKIPYLQELCKTPCTSSGGHCILMFDIDIWNIVLNIQKIIGDRSIQQIIGVFSLRDDMFLRNMKTSSVTYPWIHSTVTVQQLSLSMFLSSSTTPLTTVFLEYSENTSVSFENNVKSLLQSKRCAHQMLLVIKTACILPHKITTFVRSTTHDYGKTVYKIEDYLDTSSFLTMFRFCTKTVIQKQVIQFRGEKKMQMRKLLDTIEGELSRRSLHINNFRRVAGRGRSQTFGVVFKRCLRPNYDYSVMCWKRPYLYYLLIEFGRQFINIPFNAITLNENYKCAPHMDNGNIGQSALVSFGSFTGGKLVVHGGIDDGSYDTRYSILTINLMNIIHSVSSFIGNRLSLVYYTVNHSITLPPPSVRLEDSGTYVFYRGDEPVLDGLPHPLKNRKRKKQ
jgi:hypothetical protein